MIVTKEGRELLFDKGEGQLAKFDLKNKIMYRKSPKKDWYGVDNANLFFSDCQLTFKDKNLREFISVLHKIFMTSRYYKDSLYTNISSLFTLAFEPYEYLQQYVEEGIKFEGKISRGYAGGFSYSGITKPLTFYSKDIVKMFKKYEIRIDIPLERLFADNKHFWETAFREIERKGYDKKFIYVLIDRLAGDISMLHESYNYDIKTLLKFASEQDYSDDYRGGMSYLSDYNEMLKKMKVTKYGKYPKDIKKAHDIVMENYNLFKDENLIHEWKIALHHTDTKMYEYKNKDYSIIYPNEPKDISKEGCSLHHCVKSYIDKVIQRTTDIVFMRDNDNPDDSLITIEVKVSEESRSRNIINHYEGLCRRTITEKEEAFIGEYSKVISKRFKRGISI